MYHNVDEKFKLQKYCDFTLIFGRKVHHLEEKELRTLRFPAPNGIKIYRM